jgi:hypothetical protein
MYNLLYKKAKWLISTCKLMGIRRNDGIKRRASVVQFHISYIFFTLFISNRDGKDRLYDGLSGVCKLILKNPCTVLILTTWSGDAARSLIYIQAKAG